MWSAIYICAFLFVFGSIMFRMCRGFAKKDMFRIIWAGFEALAMAFIVWYGW